MTKRIDVLRLCLLVSVALPFTATAQEVNGKLGSAGATITIPGDRVPPAPMTFGGKIGDTVETSQPWWAPRIVPPKGAPNILLIMTDDQGYGVSGTFGGVIPTPASDSVAASGLRYTEFNSTALCSPTRSALITGRNHHENGFGVISELSTGYPGYDSYMGQDDATVGEILKEHGYSTTWIGKDHNIPSSAYGAAGPYEQWPSGMGFQYYYGFPGGETDQWTPYLFKDHTQVFPWIGHPDYNLSTDLANEAINHMRELKAANPDQPFFLYYVPGGTHSPHQPPQDWIDKFHGKFDMGWNVMRDQIFANQKKLGVIPENAKLTPWPDSLPTWDSLSADEKKLYARQAEVFAAYAAYTDFEIGRVIQEVKDEGKLDNTMIIYMVGDNGTSPEGTLRGTPNQWTAYNGILDIPVADQLKYYDAWGSSATYPHMAVAWSWAFDTPFKWTKQIASHFGGTRQGLSISWPGHIDDAGGIRNQFHHVIDIVPTILEAAKIKAPEYVNGIKQKPIEGVSMAYTFSKANADAPTTHHVQYFEMIANRGIYKDGWYANTVPPHGPWILNAPLPPIDQYKWELYNLKNDYSQNDDLAAKMPDKLKEMQALFLTEAKKYNVLPLQNTTFDRAISPRPSPLAGKSVYSYQGVVTGIPDGNSPSVLDRSYKITADVEIPQGGGDGIIVTEGGKFGGYGLYMVKGKPVFLYNFLALDRTRLAGDDILTPGKHTIVYDFAYDGPGLGKGGKGTLSVDGKTVATQNVPHTIPLLSVADESFDVGADTRTGVDDDDYQVPFPFNGTIDNVTFDVGPMQIMSAAEAAKMQKAKTSAD